MDTNPAERMKEQMEEVKEAYEQSRQSARELRQAAVDTSREAAALTDHWIRGHAWKLLGITFTLGLIIGLLCQASDEPETERVPR
jgi:ElaB/YqjD/DUF883 family membrane-anchored ribosome-binding protein